MPWVWILPFWSMNLNFSGSLVLFKSFMKFTKSASSGFRDRYSETGCKSVMGWWEKHCIVYSLFWIFSSSSNSSKTAKEILLNCLYLNPRVLPFVHFSSPSLWEGGGRGRGEQVAVWCLVASCRVKSRQTHRFVPSPSGMAVSSQLAPHGSGPNSLLSHKAHSLEDTYSKPSVNPTVPHIFPYNRQKKIRNFCVGLTKQHLLPLGGIRWQFPN